MKLLLSVIAASVSAAGHGDHDGAAVHDNMGDHAMGAHDGMNANSDVASMGGHDSMGGHENDTNDPEAQRETTRSYAKPTKAPHYDHHTMAANDHYDDHYDMHNATESWHHDNMDHGSGDYNDHHNDDYYNENYEEASSSHHESNCDGPNCQTGCADAMANWREEMKKWKYMQNGK